MKQTAKTQRPLPPKKKPHGAATAKRVVKGKKEALTVVTVAVDSELADVLEVYQLAGIDPAAALKSTLADMMMGAKNPAATMAQKKYARGGSNIVDTKGGTRCSRR